MTSIKSMAPLFDPWVWKMAWRDSRSHRGRLLLFVSSILLGVAALVAIRSFKENLEDAVNAQSKTLLGADLVLSQSRPFNPKTEALIDSIGGLQSREVRFVSMIYFPKGGGTRLVQVRAVGDAFPYYGRLLTEPREAAERYQGKGETLLDEGLMLQYGVAVGDSARLGDLTFRIAGRLNRVPDEGPAGMMVAPVVFIPLSLLDRTDLIQHGSRATYRVLFKVEDEMLTGLLKRIEPQLAEQDLRYETVDRRKRRWGRMLDNLDHFLSLTGFVALLLGCVGIGASIHVYIRGKLVTISVLKCLGARNRQAFTIYLIQAASMGLIGSLGGGLMGLFVQQLLPNVLGGFFPSVEVSVNPSLKAVLQGLSIGLGLSLMIAMHPLVSIRRTSPLAALRTAYEGSGKARDPLRIGILLMIILLVGLLGAVQTGHWKAGLGLIAGLGGAFGLLAGVAYLLMKLVRRFFPRSWRYVWRQALANLYRPNNQTLVMMLSLGLGTSLIAILYISQFSLIRQISLAGGEGRPNLVLFDIQTDQVDETVDLVRSYDLPILHRSPVVTMRVASVKGESADSLRKSSRVSRWALRREYRSTYRDHLFESEEIVAGEWTGSVTGGGGPVPISMEERTAQRLGVTLGDTVTFDVQGVPIVTTLGSIRNVEWQRVQPNFFVVFPAGVLESAPQFSVLTTRVRSQAESAKLQRRLVQRFSNVSSLDLGLILKTADEILSRVGSVIRFMALFSTLTGFIILASCVIANRYQRIHEAVLLRTLGASQRQIVQIQLLEYLLLGGLATLTGMGLALTGGWILARFVFDIAFAIPFVPLALIFTLVIGLTILLGMLNIHGVISRPPLEVLRNVE